jgi:chloramphenicol-sensitive protein RarD
MQAANPRRGYILGLSAYIIWGLFPIYFKAIASVPAWRSSSTACSGRRLFGCLAADGLEASGLVARAA